MLLHNLCCYCLYVSKRPVYRYFGICSMVACRSSYFLSAQESLFCFVTSAHQVVMATLFVIPPLTHLSAHIYAPISLFKSGCIGLYTFKMFEVHIPLVSQLAYHCFPHPLSGHLSDILHNEFTCLT